MSFPQQNSSDNDDNMKQREAQAEEMKQMILMKLLDPTARQRLMNIRMVKPDLAQTVESYLINAASTGRLNRVLTDEELKQILSSLQAPKRNFKINRI
ncbi:MAG: DNA-binding protein [Nitrososphaeraceae archaeon]